MSVDPFLSRPCLADLRALQLRIDCMESELEELYAERMPLVIAIHETGWSHAKLGEEMGLSRGRVFQIIKKATERRHTP